MLTSELSNELGEQLGEAFPNVPVNRKQIKGEDGYELKINVCSINSDQFEWLYVDCKCAGANILIKRSGTGLAVILN